MRFLGHIITTFVMFGVMAIEADIDGTVVNGTGDPIAGATVQCLVSGLADTTDNKGRFALNTTPVTSIRTTFTNLPHTAIVGTFLQLSLTRDKMDVGVTTYTLQGRQVFTTREMALRSGTHQVRWLPEQAARQTYLVELTINDLISRFVVGPLAGRRLNLSTPQPTASLSKSAAVVDTLSVRCAGYTTVKQPLNSYTGTYTITLTGSTIGNPPATFTKNVLIEDLTGTWCGFCPHAMEMIWPIEAQYGNRIVTIGMHARDLLEVEETKGINTYFKNSGFPMGRIDRVAYNGQVCMSRGDFSAATKLCIAKSAVCGLAIDAATPGTATVHAAFIGNQTGNIRLNVFLVEDSVTGYPQANSYNTIPGSHFYQLGNPLVNYVHENVFRAFLTKDSTGIPISADPTTPHRSSYTFSTTVYRQAQCWIVAFVERWAAAYTEHEVLNVQRVRVGEVQSWE
jgi:thiol-disulfide isomerase/thioredoxin